MSQKKVMVADDFKGWPPEEPLPPAPKEPVLRNHRTMGEALICTLRGFIEKIEEGTSLQNAAGNLDLLAKSLVQTCIAASFVKPEDLERPINEIELSRGPREE